MERLLFGNTHESGSLCRRCRALDVISILTNHRVEDWVGDRITGLGCSSTWATSTCCLCKLFFDLRGTSVQRSRFPDKARLHNLELRAFSTKQLRESECDFVDLEHLEDTTVLGVTYDMEGQGSPSERQEIGCIHLLSEDKAPPQSKFQARLIDRNAVAYGVILDWLRLCETQHHQKCGHLAMRNIERLWVIDCETRKVVLADDDCQYVALSYICGQFDLQQSDEAYDFDSAPRTIRDAVQVTRSLGLRYLWIDKYCIKSDDTDHMMQQVRQMHTIYEQAYLTIIAASGKDAFSGLPGVNGLSRLEQPQVRVGTCLLASSLPWISYDLQYSTWNTRGWTFQEGILSRRRLIFTDLQVYFECLHSHASEALNDPTAFDETTNSATSKIPDQFAAGFESRAGPFIRHFQPGAVNRTNSGIGILDEAKRHINAYSNRALTYDSDILYAFIGVLLKYEEVSQMRFLTGMPYRYLQNDQAGQSASEFLRCVFELNIRGGKSRRPNFPSWSWLGWSKAQMDTRPYQHLVKGCTVRVELLNGTNIPWDRFMISPEQYPRYLHIAGKFVEVTLEPRKRSPSSDPGGAFSATFNVGDETFPFYCHTWCPWSAEDDESRRKRKYPAIMYIASNSNKNDLKFIVLEPHGDRFEICGHGLNLNDDKDRMSLSRLPSVAERSFRVG